MTFTVFVTSNVFEKLFNLVGLRVECDKSFPTSKRFQTTKHPFRADVVVYDKHELFITTYVEYKHVVRPGALHRLNDFVDLEKIIFETRSTFDYSLDDIPGSVIDYVVGIVVCVDLVYLIVTNMKPSSSNNQVRGLFDGAWLGPFRLTKQEDVAKLTAFLIMHLCKHQVPPLPMNATIKKSLAAPSKYLKESNKRHNTGRESSSKGSSSSGKGSTSSSSTDKRTRSKEQVDFIGTFGSKYIYDLKTCGNRLCLSGYERLRSNIFYGSIREKSTKREYDVVVKTSQYYQHPEEIYILKKMSKFGRVPMMYEYAIRKNNKDYIYSMEKLVDRCDRKYHDLVNDHMRDILKAISELHDLGYMHRDIKSDNVMIRESDKSAVLIDFNYSTKTYQGNYFIQDPFWDRIGTQGYTAPEVDECRNAYSNKIDIYSAGITFAEWLFKIRTNSSMHFEEDIKKAFNACTERKQLCSLIEKMISRDPKLRPTAKEALDILQSCSF
ncbi:serine/threonine-protein kinase [Acrasis kona]|uniref:Serine/threonine-protein kinase n=1 Tax=Acrasis kona TaxID=1008807 RepID=A0AAW2YVB3_9EUKA